ncbi:MAG TPA: non-ribosomal peptide synthetase, partial [Pseudonocardiaceae bacterium]|nr:non-ribosomal peptide synthetase [Pseudonocardiaceae bacterium]
TVVGSESDLRVTLDPEPGDTALTFVFDGGLTIHCAAQPRDPAALDRIAAHYLAFLTAATSTPGVAIAEVDHRTAQEKQLVTALNDTTRALVHPPCIHQLVEAAVDRDPDALAVIQGATRLSFAELDGLANGLAERLTGVVPGMHVGILATRSAEFVVAALAILKSGAAYVPLDPVLPIQRLRILFRVGRVTMLLADHEFTDVAASLTDSWITVPPCAELVARPRVAGPATGTDLAYVIFTSGSTGEPKGALLDHAGRTNMIADLNERFGFGPGDRMLVVSSPSFDLSVYDVFGTLAAGATVVLPARGQEYDVEHWARLLTDEHVTLWHSVPSALTLLLNLLPERADASSMRLLILGGDWIPVDQPERVQRVFPGAEFYSLGGATEVSVDSVIYRVAAGERHVRAIPYGRPLTNQTAHVVDQHNRDTGVEQIGELVLGGVGVGWGYDGRPELTAAKFVLDPFTDRPGARMYRTGDAARLRGDGTIELLGRLDHQVKIDGVRIELGEIQAAIEADERVRQAAVLPLRDDSGRAVALAAFVVVDPSTAEPEAVIAELPERLRATLHRTSVPAEIRLIGAIPVNSNGKVDRNRLAELAAAPMPAASPMPAAVSTSDEFTDAVAEVWAKVLGLAELPAVHAGFTALGGGSLAATQVVSRLRRRFDADLSVRDVLTRGTVGEVAELLRSRAGTRRYTTIPRVN